MTAIERLEFLEIFRIQLLHTKMAKVMQDFKFCMQSEQNLDDKGTLGNIAAILGLDWASNEANKIKKSGLFEREAFQTKKWGNFGPGPSRGGGSLKNKSPKFQLENFKIRGRGRSLEIKKVPSS